MPRASIVFLTPLAALVALAMLLPIAAFVVAERRVATRAAAAHAPSRRASGVDVAALAALVAVVALLALAAAQPALSNTHSQRVRTDAEALFVVDTSAVDGGVARAEGRGRGSSAPPRRQGASARRCPSVPSGVATLTDRVLPNLLPVADAAAFDATLRQSVAIDQPPPREQSVRATNFGALAGIPGSGYFDSSAKRRADRPAHRRRVEPRSTRTPSPGRSRGSPPTKLLTMQLWRPQRIDLRAVGTTRPELPPRPRKRKAQLASLASATHGRVFGERRARQRRGRRSGRCSAAARRRRKAARGRRIRSRRTSPCSRSCRWR